ncbi:class I SAM-dependent methyltransferase [Paenisporosarcina sp. TG20]|uniref:class I SAM-dependent methyltransferase n=1 Tax=Paenisporosarcina sp. TG20 TaxID=1211706 RepID=UPI0002FBF9CB|nr:methyltransferase domain-containing protein [Paenisporosarcina sp. TG20]
MNKELFKLDCKKEFSRGMKGWDFSYLKGRTEEDSLPWDYGEIIRKYIGPADNLLDMGTGGGEVLLTLNHPYELTSVTEGYLPNLELCEKKLGHLGITVKFVDEDDHLEFNNCSFDIVINRHESFDINEVHRVLKPSGHFITQQIGGQNNRDIAKYVIKDLSDSPYKDNNLPENIKKIDSAGLKIIQADEYFPKMKFYDIGAFVYFASIIKWEFPGFTVDNCFDRLWQLELQREKQGYIESKEHRFLIISQK